MLPVLAVLGVMMSLAAQQPVSEAFATSDLTARLEAGKANYLPFLSRPSLSCGLYRLAKGAEDHQSPHRQDEIYYMLAGAAHAPHAAPLRRDHQGPHGVGVLLERRPTQRRHARRPAPASPRRLPHRQFRDKATRDPLAIV